jgi:ketosteroid isomerase-like protein
MSEPLDPRIQVLLDKQEIREAVMVYSRGVDRRDAELIESTYHPDAVDDHGDMKSSGAELAAFVTAGEQPQMMHFIGNHLSEVDGDRAISETYFISFLTVELHDEPATRTRAGRYLDRWERRDGAWKIVHRMVVDDWDRLDPIGARVRGIGTYRSARTRDDLVYQLRVAAT